MPSAGVPRGAEQEDREVGDRSEGASGGALLRSALTSPLILLLIVGTCYRTCAG